MNFIKRTLYFGYYLKESDFGTLRRFVDHASAQTGNSRFRLLSDAAMSVYRYNISLKDYFCFRFFELPEKKRDEWAGSGFMYEYQLIMNPKKCRQILEDKIVFLNHFKRFVKRDFVSLEELINEKGKIKSMFNAPSGLLVLKGSHGQVGAEVEVVKSNAFNFNGLINYMITKKYDLIEEFVVQHPHLMELSPSGLNTVRIFTQYDSGKVDILGARLRITVNSPVDNMAAGNLAAAVDSQTGVVYGKAVYSDITKADMEVHPLTGKRIIGFKIPFWDKIREMAVDAALHTPENRSVGWDIAVTADGPELIEGNHNWCKLLWQMPVKTGLKNQLVNYM
jgi:hypothetical protein